MEEMVGDVEEMVGDVEEMVGDEKMTDWVRGGW
jgi:hypothetical protein